MASSAENGASDTAQDGKFNAIKLFLQFAPLVSISIAIVGLVIAQTGKKKEIVCTYLGSDNLVHVDEASLTSSLTIKYQDTKLSSLNRLTFTFRNAGSSAIKGEDVKEPAELLFPSDVHILAATLEGTNPPGFTFKVSPDPTGSFVRFDFPLLNAGDAAYISVYTYNSPVVIPRLLGRIVDVKQLVMEDDSAPRTRVPLPFIQSGPLRSFTFWALFIISASVCATAFGFLITAIGGFVRYKLWRSKWANKYRELFETSFKKKYPSRDVDRPEGVYHMYIEESDLKASGIPKRPVPMADTWGDLFQATSIFGGIAAWTCLISALVFGILRP